MSFRFASFSRNRPVAGSDEEELKEAINLCDDVIHGLALAGVARFQHHQYQQRPKAGSRISSRTARSRHAGFPDQGLVRACIDMTTCSSNSDSGCQNSFKLEFRQSRFDDWQIHFLKADNVQLLPTTQVS
jgi:hypothetical protein